MIFLYRFEGMASRLYQRWRVNDGTKLNVLPIRLRLG
jgi:hypothetical protein